MSKGGIRDFLSALFKSEGGGGTQYKVINKYGYVGKYQFGESALSDLGYYVSDGTSPLIKQPDGHKKFLYQWKGTWTGKDGIKSLDDFRNSPDEQDVAAVAWVRLLCSRAKHYGANQYEGKVIGGITITHSGIIGAAHLKGFGTEKHPGVMQFLSSNGATDPEDANGTSVSDYIAKFNDYDLGCCSGGLGVQFVDKKKQPVAGVQYQVKAGGKVVQEGHSDAAGKIAAPVKNVPFTQTLEVWVKEVEANLAMAWSGALSSSHSTLTLTSPHSKVAARTDTHPGAPGDHRRNSKLGTYTVKPGDSLWKIAHQHGTSVAELRRANPGLDGNLIAPGQQIKLPAGGTGSGSTSAAPSAGQASPTAAPAASSHAAVGSAAAAPAPASASPVAVASAPAPASSAGAVASAPAPAAPASAAPAAPASAPAAAPAAPAAPQAPAPVTMARNDNGHPVAVAQAADVAPPSGDPKQKMYEIARADAKYGKKQASFSGPAAAHKAKLGQPIYNVSKAPNVSTGECWKYVKIALLASGMVDSYPASAEAKDAGNDLKKAGFRNVLSDPAYHIASPYDAPEGSVIVYDTTDGTHHGHAEIVLPGHQFASDYISPNSRVMRKNEPPTLIGKGRKVIGVWVK
ncbi:LysM peptidoglycan-binding domain-containing protein [Burkholderia sp. 3C]